MEVNVKLNLTAFMFLQSLLSCDEESLGKIADAMDEDYFMLLEQLRSVEDCLMEKMKDHGYKRKLNL